MSEIEDFAEDVSIENCDLYDCEYTSVDAVVNKVTVFTGCTERQTDNGVRTLVAYGDGYNRSAFFTDSKKLKDVFAAPNRHYPMRAVIKVVNYGRMYGFRVFPPSTPVTQEDLDNFERYQRNKYKDRRR